MKLHPPFKMKGSPIKQMQSLTNANEMVQPDQPPAPPGQPMQPVQPIQPPVTTPTENPQTTTMSMARNAALRSMMG